MVSTTGEHSAYYVLDDDLCRGRAAAAGGARAPSVALIDENCEPALCTVLFIGGAGGSLRAGVTENPVRLTRSVQDAPHRVTCGGAPVYVWPGGGITFMVDVTRVPDSAFGYVPTPALVAPIEFTMRRDDYLRARRPRRRDPLARRRPAHAAASTPSGERPRARREAPMSRPAGRLAARRPPAASAATGRST